MYRNTFCIEYQNVLSEIPTSSSSTPEEVEEVEEREPGPEPETPASNTRSQNSTT